MPGTGRAHKPDQSGRLECQQIPFGGDRGAPESLCQVPDLELDAQLELADRPTLAVIEVVCFITLELR